MVAKHHGKDGNGKSGNPLSEDAHVKIVAHSLHHQQHHRKEGI